MRFALALATLFALVSTPASASSPATVDQQQPVIDLGAGGLAVGGFYDQKIAQVVTAGQTGLLIEVRVPVACSPGATLLLEIQGVTGERPNGVVLGTEAYPAAAIPPLFPDPGLRSLELSTPISLTAGQKFAIVLDGDGPSPFDGCGSLRGPVGDSYPGGNLYFDSRPNAVGVWVCVCDFSGDRFDIPFATVMTASDTTPPSIEPILSNQPNAAGWHRTPVTIGWRVTDSESGIASTSGCAPTTLIAEASATVLTCSATNGAGASASVSKTIRIDRTAPVIVSTRMTQANELGWNSGDVTVRFEAADELSGIAGDATVVASLTAEGADQEISAIFTDIAGNGATARVDGISIDRSPPTIAYAPHPSRYDVTDAVAITAVPSDALSGIALVSGAADLSTPAYALGAGTHTITAMAMDKAGNSATATTSFTIVVTRDSLCALTRTFAGDAPVAASLCAKLDAASAARERGTVTSAAAILDAYRAELAAQSGKAFTADQAQILVRLSAAF